MKKGQMTSHSFNIGAVENLTYSESKADSIAKNIEGEKMYQWTGNVGLANVSDILRASTNPLCTSATTSLSDQDACNNNYLLDNGSEVGAINWTINAYADALDMSSRAWQGYASSSAANMSHYYAFGLDRFHPVVFLKSDVTLTGEGTEQNPYVIIN